MKIKNTKSNAVKRNAGNVKAKTIKAKTSGNTKANTVEERAVKSGWFECKRVYQLFKTIDLGAYRAQGEFTLCGARKGMVRKLDKAVASIGKDFVLISGELGIVSMTGTLATIEGKRCMCSGSFALALDGQKILFNGNYAALLAYIKKHGEGAGQYRNGKVFTHAIGAGNHYGVGIAGGKLARLESDTCERGKSWNYNLTKAK
jgi:hypothetical protein